MGGGRFKKKGSGGNQFAVVTGSMWSSVWEWESLVQYVSSTVLLPSEPRAGFCGLKCQRHPARYID